MTEAAFKKMTVIGVGLIGGSLARAAKANHLVDEIIGVGRNEAELQKAVEQGVIDGFETDLAKSVQGADIVILAVPLGAMRNVFAAIAPHVKNDVIISDVGSAKLSVIEDAKAAFGDLPEGFVPGHPIAGTERSGVEASFKELFENRCVILTPVESSSEQSLKKLTLLWEGTGANVVVMDAKHHDDVLAATSHLPHMLAFALVDSLATMHERSEIFQFAAGGFRDFTRIASSDPDMWRDICLANSEALSKMITRFQGELADLAEAIAHKDGDKITEIFRRAKNARDQYVVQ